MAVESVKESPLHGSVKKCILGNKYTVSKSHLADNQSCCSSMYSIINLHTKKAAHAKGLIAEGKYLYLY